MNNYTDSFEAAKLRKWIADKKEYLAKIQGSKQYPYLQKEILFHENDVLPIILRTTNLLHNEFVKYAVKAYDAALQLNCNGLLLYYPIEDDYAEQPIVGIANPRQSLGYGMQGAVRVFVDNMDGRGEAFKPVPLQIDDLL
ncbi:hypothetical protein Barb6_03374 [Bacteroidales bacterium Barb6]|nr:hypothetical protein Barb6_03374 [Bacteroidales bacterium Barb6]